MLRHLGSMLDPHWGYVGLLLGYLVGYSCREKTIQPYSSFWGGCPRSPSWTVEPASVNSLNSNQRLFSKKKITDTGSIEFWKDVIGCSRISVDPSPYSPSTVPRMLIATVFAQSLGKQWRPCEDKTTQVCYLWFWQSLCIRTSWLLAHRFWFCKFVIHTSMYVYCAHCPTSTWQAPTTTQKWFV